MFRRFLTRLRISPVEFLVAAKTGDLETVLKYIVAYEGMPEGISGSSHYDSSALCEAAFAGQTDIVHLLLAAGVANDLGINHGISPFIFAIKGGHLNSARAFLVAGVDVNQKFNYGLAALHYAAKAGRYNIANLLIAAGANINDKDISNMTPLEYATINGHHNIAGVMTSVSIRRCQPDTYKIDSNYIAAQKRRIEINAILNVALQRNVALDIPTTATSTPVRVSVTSRKRKSMHKIKVPDELKCPLSKKLMRRPLTLSSGYTYEYEEFAKCFTFLKTEMADGDGCMHAVFQCPKSEKEINVSELSNLADVTLKNQIERFINGVSPIVDYDDDLCCPIALELMVDPITMSSGVTYDRQTLTNYFLKMGNPEIIKCPVKDIDIKISELNNATNMVIKRQIDQFMKNENQKNQPDKTIAEPVSVTTESIFKTARENSQANVDRMQLSQSETATSLSSMS